MLEQRKKTPFGEVDLLFRSATGSLQIVEVKSIGDLGIVEARLSSKQRRRLGHVAEFFMQHHSEVELWLAFVDTRNKVQTFDDF